MSVQNREKIVQSSLISNSIQDIKYHLWNKFDKNFKILFITSSKVSRASRAYWFIFDDWWTIYPPPFPENFSYIRPCLLYTSCHLISEPRLPLIWFIKIPHNHFLGRNLNLNNYRQTHRSELVRNLERKFGVKSWGILGNSHELSL